MSERLRDVRVAELAAYPEGPGAPPFEDWRETVALAREVKERRAAEAALICPVCGTVEISHSLCPICHKIYGWGD